MAFRNLYSRLFGRREREVLRLLTEHLGSVLKVVSELKVFISSLIDEDSTCSYPSIFETKIEMISIYESLADDLYLKSLVTICEGAFFSGLREDFIKLFNNIDDIADFAKDSSQILARSKLEEALKKYCKDPEISIPLFLDKIEKSVEILKEAADDLGRDVANVIKKAISVKELEEEIDDIKWKLLRKIFSYKSEMDVLTLLELKDFILTLDEIADAAARSSELLIMIVTKARA